jgi:choline dehydrogenase-like flavoprotein
VLCAGAIENARLLLASNRVIKVGLGNEHDTVGRFLMDHPRGPVGYFEATGSLEIQRAFGDYRFKGPRGLARVVPGLALSHDLQRREELLNCALWIYGEPSLDDPIRSATELARLHQPFRNAANLFRDPHITAEGVKRVMMGGRGSLRKMSTIALTCIVEQRPDPASRLTLSDRTDALGVPLPVIDWRVSEQEATTVRRACRLFSCEMTRLGLPVPELLPMIQEGESDFHLRDAAHPTGTTRMSLHPREGTVNPNCAVHGVRGLYVGGSSVFPTSGHANPTQMIVAMAVRLADHLKRETRT